MMYRNHREYSQPQNIPDFGILRSWLRGQAGTESLKEWLATINA